MRTSHHHLIDKIALGNAVIGALALYPQLYRAIAFPELRPGLSTVSFMIIFLNSIVWVLYGKHRKESAIVISATLNALAAVLILIVKFL